MPIHGGPRRTMQIRRLNHISARRSSVGALPLVLALGATSASAADREAPHITAAYANGPGAITLAWTHAGEGIFGFAVQVDGGGQWLDVQRLDHTFTQHTLVGLQPD